MYAGLAYHVQVRVMTALRHPNVVLFMAASTKPPKLCIVMELMGLGLLFDLLHNELISDLPGRPRRCLPNRSTSIG